MRESILDSVEVLLLGLKSDVSEIVGPGTKGAIGVRLDQGHPLLREFE
jgi:hypothetical protein